jgi:hypothetical protein
MLNFSRKTEAKLALLREVLQRVKAGEDVDVERLLGTGDPEKEREWEDVMQELESTDMIREAKKKKEAKTAERKARRAADGNPTLATEDGTEEGVGTRGGRPKFMM